MEKLLAAALKAKRPLDAAAEGIRVGPYRMLSKLGHRLRANALARAGGYDWDEIARQIEAVAGARTGV